MTMQQYCLRWNHHQPNFISVFSSLLNSESLVDVTLAAEGRHLQAHKVVLSACSTYFQSLFTINPCQHPIVILKDVKFLDLKIMVDFMFYGEVNVSQEQLPHILKTAEMLKIKGLAEIPVDQSMSRQDNTSDRAELLTTVDASWNNETIQNQSPSPCPSSPSCRRKRLRKSSTGSGSGSLEKSVEEPHMGESTQSNIKVETVIKSDPSFHIDNISNQKKQNSSDSELQRGSSHESSDGSLKQHIHLQSNIINTQLVELYSRSAMNVPKMNDNELIDITSDDSKEETQPTVTKASNGPSTSIRLIKPDFSNNSPNNFQDNVDRCEKMTVLQGKKRKLEDKTVLQMKKKKKTQAAPTDAAEVPTVDFKDVVGMESTLDQIILILGHMVHEGLLSESIGKISPSRGILLHGPSGCGKTLLAHAIAGELNYKLIKVAASDLVAGILIKDLFQKAVSLSPSVVFIDNIEVITNKHSNSQKDMQKRIVSQFCSCLDELSKNPLARKVIVIAATPYIDSVDPSLRGSGRFSEEIELAIPNEKSRIGILKLYTRTECLAPGFDWNLVGAITPGYVGDDLKKLIAKAKTRVLFRFLNKYKNQLIISREAEGYNEDQTINTEERESDKTETEIIVDDGPKETVDKNKTNSSQEENLVLVFEEENSKQEDEDISSSTVPTETNRNVIVIASTPYPDSMDPSLRGSGRLPEEIIKLGILNEESRIRFLKLNTRTERLAPDFDWNLVGAVTPCFLEDDLIKLIARANSLGVNRFLNKYKNQLIISREAEGYNEDQTINTEERESDKTETEIIVDDDPKETVDKNKTNSSQVPTETNNSDEKMAVKGTEMKNDIISEQLRDAESCSSLTWDWPREEKCKFLRDGKRIPEHLRKHIIVTEYDFIQAAKIIKPRTIRIPNICWDDVGSLKDVKEKLMSTLLNATKYRKISEMLKLTIPAGVLLFGPPGCGKTLVANALANEARINFISVKGRELLNMYVGESEKAVRMCFAKAKSSAPCTIFFDDLDALCPSSDREVVSQMMKEMDSVEGVNILASTNRPDLIDHAILNRFDKIYVGMPSPSDRVEIIKSITKNYTHPKISPDVDLESICTSENLSGCTGADLSALLQEAARIHFNRMMAVEFEGFDGILTTQDFAKAIAKIRPSVSEKEQALYKEMKKLYTPTGKNEIEEEMDLS